MWKSNQNPSQMLHAKCGKACGVDGLAAEHFIYVDESI